MFWDPLVLPASGDGNSAEVMAGDGNTVVIFISLALVGFLGVVGGSLAFKYKKCCFKKRIPGGEPLPKAAEEA